jgi:hypothetical protein
MCGLSYRNATLLDCAVINSLTSSREECIEGGGMERIVWIGRVWRGYSLFYTNITQNRRCLWLVTQKTGLHWYERLARSSVTKLIGQQQLSAWFSRLPEERCFKSIKNQRCLWKIQNQPRPLFRPRSVNFTQHFRNLSRKTVPLRNNSQH